MIPILLEGARIPKADELPEDLKELALRNGMEIRHASFQDDMNRLIRGLKEDGVFFAGGDITSEFPTKVHGAESQLKDGLWGFLRDKGNQQVLGWLGGGLVVVATGLWAAFVYFFPAPKSQEAKSPMPAVNVQADCSGIAIGGNVTGATITTGGTTNSDCAPRPK